MLRRPAGITAELRRLVHTRAKARTRVPKPPPPPSPPKPPEKPYAYTHHGRTWHDPFRWMSELSDKVSMRHMEVCMEQEEKYTEAVMVSEEKLRSKLFSEMSYRMASPLSTSPVRWGPWLYYKRVEEGKQYPVFCRRSASLHGEFLAYEAPSAGFDFTTGKRIEQILLDHNQEAERFGGYAYEEHSEVSPDHQFLAYTMYDKDNDNFVLSVRDLATGLLCDMPKVSNVANLAWAMDGKTLLYTVTDSNKRPCRIYCFMVGSGKDHIMILEELDENIHVSIRNTKDFRFIMVYTFSSTSSKVHKLNGADPFSGITLIWECGHQAHCIVEHHKGFLYMFTNAGGINSDTSVDFHYLIRSPVESASVGTWENVFVAEPGISLEDVDICSSHLVFILKVNNAYRLCSLPLPLYINRHGGVPLSALRVCFLTLPEHVCKISPGQNYDFHSSTMRFIISSPVMPDAVVDYNLSNADWKIVQQENILQHRTQTLYGTPSNSSSLDQRSPSKENFPVKSNGSENEKSWNDLSEYYSCEQYEVSSHDVTVPLTIVYSRKLKLEGKNPCLLHGHGSYGEILDKRWRSEQKSLLDRGWVIAYAEVRGGGGKGIKWHKAGMRSNKLNSIHDYISCARFLIGKGIVQDNKLAGWGYGAGGMLVASAINSSPDLFRAAVLKVPFLDPTHTLLDPALPLLPSEYEEFGYPDDIDDFLAIREYSPYDNIIKDAVYPSVLVTSSLNTKFGMWEAAKWVARVRQNAIYDPKRPILLNLTADLVDDNKYLSCKEAALETAFLIKTMDF